MRRAAPAPLSSHSQSTRHRRTEARLVPMTFFQVGRSVDWAFAVVCFFKRGYFFGGGETAAAPAR